MDSVEHRAYAKINLTLEVLGRRQDGFHEIASVVQTIDLFDTLVIEPADEIMLYCDRPELASPANLALRAAQMLRKESGYRGGARVSLRKGIPVAGGLGGGSSDAAATLTGLNQLWGLGLKTDELEPIAARLGSDVPFFLRGGTALLLGRGERVRPLPPAELGAMVLLSPDIGIPNKTAALYAKFSPSGYTRGDLSRKLAARIGGGGDVPPTLLFNAFDEVARETFEDLGTYWDTLHSLGAREVHVTGTGPSLFALISRKERGTAIQLLLERRHGWRSYLVSPWQPAEVQEA